MSIVILLLSLPCPDVFIKYFVISIETYGLHDILRLIFIPITEGGVHVERLFNTYILNYSL